MTRFARLTTVWLLPLLLLSGLPASAWEVAASAAGEIETLLAAQRTDEALELSREHFELLAEDEAVRAAHGRALFRNGELEEAGEVLATLAETKEPRAARGLITLARLHGARGRFERATALAERALELNGSDPVIQFWAAELVADAETSLQLLRDYVAQSPQGQEDWLEAARGALRLQQALAGRAVWRYEQMPERIELPLRLVWSDYGGRLGYVVEARIGAKDKPVKLLLDTGSTGLFLVERMARKRGFEFLSEETVFGGGGDKRHRSRKGTFPSFRLGELRFADALAGTTRRELEPYGKFHGLLGIQALRGYLVTLDFKAQTLTLERIDPEAPTTLEGDPYWLLSGQMLVRANLNETNRGLFLFDTGASWSILSNRFAATLEGVHTEPTRGMRGFGGAIRDASTVRGATVQLQGLTSGERDLRAFDMSVRNAVADVEVAGFIGLDLLDTVRITIDTVAQRVQVVSLRKSSEKR